MLLRQFSKDLRKVGKQKPKVINQDRHACLADFSYTSPTDDTCLGLLVDNDKEHGGTYAQHLEPITLNAA